MLPPFKPIIAVAGFLIGLISLYLIAFVFPIAAFVVFADIDVPDVLAWPFLCLNALYYAHQFNFGGGFVLGFIIGFYVHARTR